jgi:acetolactate synthase-1/2/3 large subunit
MEEQFYRMGEILPDDAIVVTDCGLHQIIARRSMATNRPSRLIAPSDFQSMGFGIPAAVGAKYGVPGRPVIAMIGDGGLAVTGFELLTAVRENLDLLAIVFCDSYLGQIRADQLKGFGADFGTALGSIALKGFSESVGARYFDLRHGFQKGLAAAVNSKGVRIVDLPLRDTSQARAMALGRSVRSRVRDLPGVSEIRAFARGLRKKPPGP